MQNSFLKNRTSQIKIFCAIIFLFIVVGFGYYFIIKNNTSVVPYLKENGKYIVVESINMKAIDTFEYEDCKLLKNGFIVYMKNSKYGLYTKYGSIITPPIYSDILDFEDGYSIIYNDDKYGIINEEGDEIISPKYEEIKIFKSKYFAVKNNNKWGYCNEEGKEIISPQFDRTEDFSNDFAAVSNGSSFGYINKEGRYVIAPQFKVAFSFHNGNAIVQKENNEICLINIKGEIIKNITTATIIYDLGEGFVEATQYYDENNMSYYWNERKSAIIDSSGKLLTSFEFYNNQDGVGCVLPFKDGYAAVCKGDFWGVIDKNGKELISPKYTNMLFFNEGFSSFSIGGTKELIEGEGVQYYDYFGEKKGFVSFDGKEIYTPQYDGVGSFSEGFASVWKNSKCGFINTSGKEISQLNYEDVGSFSEGLSIVKKGNKWGYIDKNGIEVITLKYDDDGSTDGEEGSINFTDQTKFNNGFAIVYSNNKRFYIDKFGKEYRDK
jgi:hypothetical protein